MQLLRKTALPPNEGPAALGLEMEEANCISQSNWLAKQLNLLTTDLLTHIPIM